MANSWTSVEISCSALAGLGGTSPSQGGVFLSDLNLRPEH